MEPASVMAMIHQKSRDNARTPMQWDASAQAGFTTGAPWIKPNPNYRQINVAADPPRSQLYFTPLSRADPAVEGQPRHRHGWYELLLDDHEEIHAFAPTLGADRLLVVLNFSMNQPVFALPPAIEFTRAGALLANYAQDRADDLRWLRLRPYEARVHRRTEFRLRGDADLGGLREGRHVAVGRDRRTGYLGLGQQQAAPVRPTPATRPVAWSRPDGAAARPAGPRGRPGNRSGRGGRSGR